MSYLFIVGVGTKIDPSVCRADGLVGQLLGELGTLPKIYIEITINYLLFRRLIDARNDTTQKDAKVCFSVLPKSTQTLFLVIS